MNIKKNFFPIFSAFFLIVSCITKDDNVQNAESIVIQKETVPVEAAAVRPPFTKGVNFSGWFEANSAQSIPFTKYSEQDFADVKSLGADVIRLPIKMHNMTNGEPSYMIDPLLYKFLDKAVDWAEKYKLFLIIDNHSFDPVKGLKDDIDKVLIPVWTQIARRYKDRGNFIIYEILNEPHGISDERWGAVQGMAIEAIRRIDKKHAIIVGGTDYNSINKLSALPLYSDKNLIYTFHFYDPYLFTHQGAGWGGPPVLTNLKGVPFPADSRRMPKIPADLKGTWVESSLNYSYAKDSLPQTLYNTLNKAVSFSKERNVPLFCGEFGVYMINSINEDRVRWYDFISDALDRRGIARTSWDYYGGFGVFNGEYGDFNSSLNTEVVSAMGFTSPPQKPRSVEKLKTGFTIYDDYPNRMFAAGFWGEKTDFSFYDTYAPRGEFAIRWGNAGQYNIFWFDFGRYGDLSELASSGYCLEFSVRRGATMSIKPRSFDVRFVNEESESSIPWRMTYTIDDSMFLDGGNYGRWHVIRIPLADMKEQGAWLSASSQWISAQGKFSWEKVRQLEFVAEHSDLKDIYFWFDDIRIVK